MVPENWKQASLTDKIPTIAELQKKYHNDFDQLAEDQEKLIEQILEDEEQLIFKHNSNCKEDLKMVESEMAILRDVDKPGSDVEQYVANLDQIILKKMDKLSSLRSQLLEFYTNIKTEQMLNKMIQQEQGNDSLEEPDMNQAPNI